LNLFRGIIPPIFGFDLSPLLAFFVLNLMTNVTAAVGAEIPVDYVHKVKSNNSNLRTGMLAATRRSLSNYSSSNSLNKLLERQERIRDDKVSLDL
jgi:YggT family protein